MELKNLGLQKIQFNINDKIGQIEKLVGKEGDNLTRGLEIQLLHNNVVVEDISDINCMLIAKQRGAKVEDTFVVPGTKVDGKYEIIYPSNLMKKGIVEAEIRFTQGEQILTSFIFEIDMARTLVVEEITDSIYEQRLIDVIVEVVANEEARIANENTRISNEDERLTSETERKFNEVERVSQENTRIKNENARVAEEDIRIANESIRVANETSRETNEELRKSNEVDRVAFYEMLQQMLKNGELNGEVTLAELNELAGDHNELILRLTGHIGNNSHVYDEGSNSYGEWIRFENGWMICCGEVIINTTINTAWGALFYVDVSGFNYPKPFSTQPKIQLTSMTNTLMSAYLRGNPADSSSGTIRLIRPTRSNANADYIIHYMAIGKWQ